MLIATSAHAQQLATDRVEALMLSGQAVLPTHEERLTVDIDGEHARSTLLQVYTNDTGGRIEGLYHLRPGSGSHVDGFAYWNGEEKIVGEVFERETAHRVYNSVTARRRDPGLLEEDGEGAFAFKVFPIEAHENKRVEVSWSRWLERHAQTVHYRAPLGRRDAEIVITISGAVKNVRSSTHKLHVEKVAGGVRLRSEGAIASGELDLDWDVDEAAWTPDAYVQPNGREEGWFALSLAAPVLPANTVTAKDLTIVIDRSGSMQGDKLDHAKLAAAGMIRMLGADDRLNVISFSDEVDPLFKTPQTLDAATRSTAAGFITRLDAGGGTDIALALSTAVQSQERGSERPQVVVFLTDGQSDAQKAAAVDTGNVRLFTLGLGKDVNKPLLSRLAAQKRGRFVFIEEARSIEPEVARLAATIAKPLLVDVSVEVQGVQATRIYPRTLPDLFAEDEPADLRPAPRHRHREVHRSRQARWQARRVHALGRARIGAHAAVDRRIVGAVAHRSPARGDLARQRQGRAPRRGPRSRARVQLRDAVHRISRGAGARARQHARHRDGRTRGQGEGPREEPRSHGRDDRHDDG